MNDTDKRTPDTQSRGLRVFGMLDAMLHGIEKTVVAGGILIMALIMVLHVLGRLLFGTGLPGTVELTEILIILVTFVGVSYGVRSARHISMAALYDQLSGTYRKALLVVLTTATGVLMFYLAWESFGYVEAIHSRGRATSALQIPLWIVYAVLPIGFALAGIQYWLTALRNLTTRGTVYRSFTEQEGYAEVPEEEEWQERGEGRGHL